ncbi:glycosyl transferase [Aliidongia dinghuensis]|uniref:Glycosyl transferase n=1 Tax=Aliidongia dinghuensis TaxID=1867774 RepID=A0A8J2YWG8_9PROT|nr:glycosyltransferase [Aliidongia dinghuensis]GGF32240.1 glycosyl transferase [Aliidongia dinghuensis]
MTIRVLIHVQHLLGTGHLQRSALIARALVAEGAAVTLVTGGMPLPGFRIEGARIVQLPPLRATDATFRTLVGSDGRPLDAALEAERRQLVLAAFAESRPQVVVTETYPFGRRALRFELEPLIEAVRAARPRPALVASIRDILVAKPDAAKRHAMIERFEADYDRLLVHADPQLIRLEASLPEAEALADRTRYTGFVAPAAAIPGPGVPAGEVVVSAGGGVVGAGLLRTALEARPLTRYAATPWRLVTGRNLPEDKLAALERLAGDGVAIERFRPDLPALFARAALSISQAGYNTAIELLQARVPMVLVPFAEAAETEQTVRARLLAAAGAAQMVEAAALDAATLAAAIDQARRPPLVAVDLDGARNAAWNILHLATERTP